VKDGEAIAIWNRYGEHRQVIGPRLVRLFFSSIRFLDRKTAGPKEYLQVELANGTVEHLRGPVTLYENPVMHTAIRVLRAVTLLSASDCVVVHRQADSHFDKSAGIQASGLSNESIQRVVIRGPNTYYPGPRETLLESCKPSPSKSRLQGQGQASDEHSAEHSEHIFHLASRPWVLPFPFGTDQLQGTVNLAFRFSLTDLEAMLDHTSDLMGDLYDAAIADLVNIAASTTEASQMNNQLKGLNNFSFFPILLLRSASMGVTMESVSFRGYERSPENRRAEDAVKDIHAAMSRQALVAQQEESRIAADIAARQARLAMEHALEAAVLAGKQARLSSEQEFHQKEQECEEELDRRRLNARLEHHRLLNDESMRVLTGLKELGADITKLLCEGDKSNAAAAAAGSGRVVNGRESLVKTSPALNDWFTAPDATAAEGKKQQEQSKK
jgi:hypothetical protein